MTFENASVTKGIMIFLAVTSTVAGIFDLKHNLHLQLVPHLSTHHQYWRLLIHHLACATSSDLLLTELILYNAAINVERGFGSVKYASFLLIALGLNTIGTMLALIVLQRVPILGRLTNNIPAGPTAIAFSILFQYFRLVPEAYHFRILGLTFSDKFWVYGTGLQLALGHVPSTLLTSIVGLTSGYFYRSDIMQLKGWRVPHSVVLFGQHWIVPIFGQDRPSRRTNRVLPEPLRSPLEAEEPLTTSRRSSRPRNNARPQFASGSQDQPTTNEDSPSTNTRGVVRQWVSELTEVANPNGRGDVRVPTDAEVQMVTSMFPDIGRDVVLGVLQRSSDAEAAVETLLSSSRTQV
ncbi:hypothetical protein BDY19DRAFT_924159 [Irpex rosettiformis]|uniref:Uncharacterized protein n=1 Tax=Irpex rosettiformis TaxID=378272 RepID=A0ACB8UDT9_9APHY|nr:hypothetical protein BDY19DRAFT_924159 [Irpex rosettiformis]